MHARAGQHSSAGGRRGEAGKNACLMTGFSIRAKLPVLNSCYLLATHKSNWYVREVPPGTHARMNRTVFKNSVYDRFS